MTARIGPNAIIQTTAALCDRLGSARAAALLAESTGRQLSDMPEHMVDEDEVIRLVHGVGSALGPDVFVDIFRDAGRRTAEYLIANRIPVMAQRVMRILPRRAGLRLLLGAVARHSWTFAGSAAVRVTHGANPQLVLGGCPMCRGLTNDNPCCHFYTATLERLVQRLVSPRVAVAEVACEATGAPACVFAFVF